MTIDSNLFDLKQMNSGAISLGTPLQLGYGLVPFMENLIQSMPEDEESIEFRIRSIVNILIISKLQSDIDRRELEEAKTFISYQQNKILNAKPYRVGGFEVMNLGRWTTIGLADGVKQDTKALCDNLSEIFDKMHSGEHFIFDFSKLQAFDFNFAAYLIGFQGMLANSGRRMSIAWLPKSSVESFSTTTHDSLMSKFKLFKKGAFLLSCDSTAQNSGK